MSQARGYTLERDDLDPEIVTINMGPSHPSTHGVLRLVLKLDGEIVVKATPVVGYLHRGYEKIAEAKTFHQYIPYTDRLDYLAPLSNNVGYALAVEKAMGIVIPPRGQAIRVICCEMARISAHLLWLATHALDLGAGTVFFHAFRDREPLSYLMEWLTGARLTTSYTRIGGQSHDIPDGWAAELQRFIDYMPPMFNEYESLLTRNRIWMQRTQGVGVITRQMAIDYASFGIRVNAIAPGTIASTEMGKRLLQSDDTPETQARRLSKYPIGRYATEEEIASAALFLMSDEASFATGSVLTVDGGLTAL
jgi:NADH-quinone oxidoreductase subunit D